jgi:DNA-binding MarR family transcriptional regulator
MIDGFEQLVNEPNLLRIMIQIRNWEGCHHKELKTLSGQELYFRIAETYLKHPGKDQHLKQLAGAHTERATRLKLREFEEQGLINVLNNTEDHRTKRVIPTAKFLKILNAHMSLVKQICDEQYLMIDKKSNSQSSLAKDDRIHF